MDLLGLSVSKSLVLLLLWTFNERLLEGEEADDDEGLTDLEL